MTDWDVPGAGEPTFDAEALVAVWGAWAASARAKDAAASRSRERWLRQQAEESATFTGILLDLAEERADATMVVGARNLSGRLVGVGTDLCVIAERPAGTTVVALAHLRAVRLAPHPHRGAHRSTGDRRPALEMRLADVLSALAADRSPVRIGLVGGETVSGVLVALGEDVLTVRPPGGLRVHIAMAAVETVTPA